MATPEKYLKPDNKGRIQLGKLAKDIVRFEVVVDENGCIILHPEVAIPVNEAWLFKNKEALKSVKTGLEQSAKGEVKKRGNFVKFTKFVEE